MHDCGIDYVPDVMIQQNMWYLIRDGGPTGMKEKCMYTCHRKLPLQCSNIMHPYVRDC